MPPEKIQGFEARIFSSEEALANGLIDKIGYLENAFAEAMSLAKIQRASLVRYETRKGFFNGLLMKTKIGSFPEMNPAAFLPPTGEMLYLDTRFLPLTNKN
jgi:ClpP class serine protease